MKTKNSLLRSLGSIGLLFIISCSTGHCVRDGLPSRDTAEKGLSESDAKLEVTVAKADGSRQCGQGSGIPLETMAKELEGIEVVSSEKRSDGLMRVAMCGHPTGMHNVYKVRRGDLKKALSRGFQVFGKDPRLKK